MPIYEYRCAGCERPSSALVPSWNSPDPECPHCGAHRLTRQVSTFATTRPAGDGFDGADFGGGGDDFGEGGDDYGAGDDFGPDGDYGDDF